MSTRRVYTEDGEASYFLDYARASLPEGVLAQNVVKKAEARLMAHAEEQREAMLDGSAEGRGVLQSVRDSVRCDDVEENRRAIEDAERRAITQTAFGEWSTPQYLTAEWTPYRSPISPFADAARQLVLPDVGYQLHVPGFTSATSTTVDTLEAVGLPESSPSAGYISDPIPVEQAKGAVTVSQQLLDRGGAPDGQGGAFDVIMAQQLHEQMRASMDQYVIGVALAGATTVTDSSSLTTALWWTDVNTACEKLADTAGTRLQATHVFHTSDFHGWLRRQIDDDHRPIWIPDVGAVLQSEPAGEPFTSSGWTGLNWAGSGGSGYVDDNLPANSSNATWTQVIVANMPSLLVWKAPQPLTNAIPYTHSTAQDLSVLIYTRQYMAALTKFSGGFVVISGSGYASLS